MLYLSTDPTDYIVITIQEESAPGDPLRYVKLRPLPLEGKNLLSKGWVNNANFYQYRDDKGIVHSFSPDDIHSIRIGEVDILRDINPAVISTDPEIIEIHNAQLVYRHLPLRRIFEDEEDEMQARGIFRYTTEKWMALRDHFRQLTPPSHAFFLRSARSSSSSSSSSSSPLGLEKTLKFLTDNNRLPVIIAGGALISLMLDEVPDDYDCYFQSPDDYNAYLYWILTTQKVTKLVINSGTTTVTILHRGVSYKLQLINRIYPVPGLVIVGFDLPASAIMYHRGQVWMSDRARLVLEKGYMWVDPTVVSNNYGVRLMKYGFVKGIPTVVEGLDPRQWVADHPTHFISWLLNHQTRPSELGIVLNNLGFLIYLNEYYQTHPVPNETSDYEKYHRQDQENIIPSPVTLSGNFAKWTIELPHARIYSDGNLVRESQITIKPQFTRLFADRRYGYQGYYDSSQCPQTLGYDTIQTFDIIPFPLYNALIHTTYMYIDI